MPSKNEFIVAAAGSGKTTRVVQTALAAKSECAALITYTLHNVQEITDKLYQQASAIPPHIEIWSWYSFLLHELARPYQRSLHEPRIDGLHFKEGKSDWFAKRSDLKRFYFSSGNLIYSDKAACFVCECDKASQGSVMRRLEERFDHIYIDEVQDLAGYDLDLVELLLKSKIRITLVGDPRQATYKTNNSSKNKAYGGSHIVAKLREWDKQGLGELKFEQHSRRCNQAIATFADALFPNEPVTISLNAKITGHDGVFFVPGALVDAYVARFAPQVLRLTKQTDCRAYSAMNFGQSKGLTFDRILIFPHGKACTWLKTGDLSHIAPSAAKFYVGLTRARYSVAIVFDDTSKVVGAAAYS